MLVAGDHAARNAVVRALLVCGKAVGVAVDVLVMAGMNRCAFGIFNAFVG